MHQRGMDIPVLLRFFSPLRRELPCGVVIGTFKDVREHERLLRKAVRHLARHRTREALSLLKRCVTLCPSGEKAFLGRAFHLLGISLRRMGACGPALRAWLAAYRIRKEPRLRRRILSSLNEYGMLKQHTPEQDDWKAFYAIQVRRYLSSKRSAHFSSRAEKDMIDQLIWEYWRDVRRMYDLSSLSTTQKLQVFHDVEIVFPWMVFIPPEATPLEVPTPGFAPTRKCTCGSGLPFMLCCGRTKNSDELWIGSF